MSIDGLSIGRCFHEDLMYTNIGQKQKVLVLSFSALEVCELYMSKAGKPIFQKPPGFQPSQPRQHDGCGGHLAPCVGVRPMRLSITTEV
jgi:hypothetical protein